MGTLSGLGSFDLAHFIDDRMQAGFQFDCVWDGEGLVLIANDAMRRALTEVAFDQEAVGC